VEGGSFCVVAMGRLGGREMTAASDLDLVFIYDAPETIERSDGARPLPLMTYYARLAQRLIAALTVLTAAGGLYDVDMRLRPTGNKGPAAVSLASFSRYHAQAAWTWERLALTRARVVAGPAALQRKIEQVMRESLTRDAEPATLAHEVREMRDRLAAEFRDRGPWELKFARGGLVDIEFVAQFLQLRHGRHAAEVLHPNTVTALERLSRCGLLNDQDANAIIAAARLQLVLLQILRISSVGAFDPEQATGGMKALLMRAAGADEFHALEIGLAAAQAEARSVFDRLLPA
jgi:glutamate-ammonia-ligase adenylyltransferase